MGTLRTWTGPVAIIVSMIGAGSGPAADPPAPVDRPAPTAVSATSQPTALPSSPAAALPNGAPPVCPGPVPGAPALSAELPTLAIDLPTALRLANAANPTIGVARARVQEAYARLRQAQVMWLPDLVTGPAYNRHDGLIQNSRGELFDVSKWNFFMGGGAGLTLETSDALFAPLIARRLLDAQAAAARAVTFDIQLRVALAYWDLLQAYGALAVNAETVAHAEEIVRFAESAERNGFGKTPADANRARTEAALRRQERARLEGQAAVASARLAQLLLLEPTVRLRPAEPAVLPLAIVPLEAPLNELVATGLMNRPELAESRALVAASAARLRQARVGPLLPRLSVSYLAGDFGGGINDNTQQFGGRGDGMAEAVWTLHNFGAGDVARVQAQRAQVGQANFHVLEVQAQVAADVTQAASVAVSRQRALADAQRGVQQGEEMYRRLLRWTVEVGFRARQYEAVELLLAEQALNQARMEYLAEVIEFNQDEFRLYWAMGQPPLEALPKVTPLPQPVPVEPRPIATPPAR